MDMPITNFSLYQVIKNNARCYSDRIAWFEASSEKGATFADALKEVHSVAAGLQNMGVSKGDRIGVVANNSLNYFFTLFNPSI